MSDDETVNEIVNEDKKVDEPTTIPISRLNKEITKRKSLETAMIDMQSRLDRFEDHSNASLKDKGDYSTLYEKSNVKNLELSEANIKLQDQLIKFNEKEQARHESLMERLPEDLKSFGIDMEVDKLQSFVDKQKKFNINMPHPDVDTPRPTFYKDNLEWIKKDPSGYLKARKEGRLSKTETLEQAINKIKN